MTKIFLISLTWVFITPLWSQQSISMADTLYSEYIGHKTIKQIVPNKKDTIIQYTFQSKPLHTIENGIFQLKDLKINGDFINNRPNGNWNFSFKTTNIEETSLSNQKKISLNYKINGNDVKFTFPFSNGNLKGATLVKNIPITNGILGKESIIQTFNFNNDTLSGFVNISTDSINVNGKLNAGGYFDSYWTFEYPQDTTTIKEERWYDNGFLLALIKVNKKSSDTLEYIIYDRIMDNLEKLKSLPNQQNFKMSDDWFGVEFNLGYHDDDPKRTNQMRGNQILMDQLNFISKTLQPFRNNDQIHLKLTRKFEFTLTAAQDSLLLQLMNQMVNLNNKINNLITKPSFLLRKDNSNTLSSAYNKLIKITNKISKINEITDSIQAGAFKYKYMSDHYNDSMTNLNVLDTFTFVIGKDIIEDTLVVKKQIDYKNSIIEDLYEYAVELDQISAMLETKIKDQLDKYESQERIDSLDHQIALLENEVVAQFELNDENLNLGEKFQQKLYNSIKEKFINELKAKYLNNHLDEQNLMSIGNQLICYYDFLRVNVEAIKIAGELKSYWNDSLFTTLVDNPFDTRKLETKILPGVQNSATILLNHYANQMLNAKNCEQLSVEMNKILELKERVEVLAKSHKNAIVLQYDKVLRRERVPLRIERILKL